MLPQQAKSPALKLSSHTDTRGNHALQLCQRPRKVRMTAVRQGCTNVFSKATGAEIPAIKLRPGVALPHVTLPTTEV